MLSLIAAGLYALVAACCVLAARASIKHRQMSWHSRGWILVAVLFIVLAVFRVVGIEEMLRADLRLALHVEGAYEERRTFQRPVVAAIIMIGSAMAGWWIFRVARAVKGRRNIAAVLAFSNAALMIFLLVLRLVSLHAVDAILFGPAKINWIVDIGSSLIVMASAMVYRRVVSERA